MVKPNSRQPLRVTVLISERNMPNIKGCRIVSVEEKTPAGWTRRLKGRERTYWLRQVEVAKQKGYCAVYGIPFDNHEEMHAGANCTRRVPGKVRSTASAERKFLGWTVQALRAAARDMPKMPRRVAVKGKR